MSQDQGRIAVTLDKQVSPSDLRKLITEFREQGWQPYTETGDTWHLPINEDDWDDRPIDEQTLLETISAKHVLRQPAGFTIYRNGRFDEASVTIHTAWDYELDFWPNDAAKTIGEHPFADFSYYYAIIGPVCQRVFRYFSIQFTQYIDR